MYTHCDSKSANSHIFLDTYTCTRHSTTIACSAIFIYIHVDHAQPGNAQQVPRPRPRHVKQTFPSGKVICKFQQSINIPCM